MGAWAAMVFGGVSVERIQLNEESVWSGSPQDADNPAGREALPRIRELLFAGRYVEAQELTYQAMVCLGQGSGFADGANIPYGSYQTLGDFTLRLLGAGAGATPLEYRRSLNLDTAVATTGFVVDGVRHTREVLASRPAGALVVHWTVDRPGALSFEVELSRIARATTTAVSGARRRRAGDGRRDARRARRRRAALRGARARAGHRSISVGSVLGKPPADPRRRCGDPAPHRCHQLRHEGAADAT